MVDTGTGNLYIVGSFKRMSPDPDFKVTCPVLYVLDNVMLDIVLVTCIRVTKSMTALSICL
jgi:hypothetical protein